jgi:hypothetical protein
LLGTDEAVLDLPPLRPRSAAIQLLPSLSIATNRDHAFRFAARMGDSATWTFASPVGTLPPTSPDDRAPEGTHAGGEPNLRAEIDVFRAKQPIREVSVRVWLRARDRAAVLEAPTLFAVSLSDDLTETHASPTDVVDRIALSVPALSQMEAPEDIRMRICSPTCVAMVLAYWGSGVDLVDLSEEMRDARQDLYGVWPAAILAAARRGLRGYLLRFPSWGDAEWCLRRRLPVIASIRYRAGELEGAAVEATSGHLVVLTGMDGANVLVNDPAAPSRREVPRAYTLRDLQRVWLERSGVGYVLFPPSFIASG